MVFGPINRRNALGQIATTTAALGFAPIRALAQAPNPGPGPMMTELSAYMGAARMRALPEEVTEQAKYHLLDTIAAMISGSELPPGQAAQRCVREHGGNGATTVVGVALTAAPIDAALANGVMAHSDETDDSTMSRAPIRAARWCRRRWRGAKCTASTAPACCGP